MKKRQQIYNKILTTRVIFLVYILIYALSYNANSQHSTLKRDTNYSQEQDSSVFEINVNTEPDFVEIVNFYGKDYYKIYMSPEKLCRKYNSNSLDLDKYKGFYYQEVQILPNIKEIADSLKQIMGVDSVIIINSTSVCVFMTEANYYARFSDERISTSEEYPGYYIHRLVFREAGPILPIKYTFDNKPEILEKRTPYARHFLNTDGSVTAYMTIVPTSYYSPVTEAWIDIDLTEPLSPDIIELLTSNPTKDTYSPPMTYYGWHVEYSNDGDAPYNYIDTGVQLGYLSPVGQDSDWFDEYHRASYQFDITSIPDGSDVTYVGLWTYVTNNGYGEFDSHNSYADVKQLNLRIAAYDYVSTAGARDCKSHDIIADIGTNTDAGSNNYLAYFSYDYVSKGEGWTTYGYYNLGATACSDVEGKLAGNWFCLGLQEWGEEWGWYTDDRGVVYTSNVILKINYIPCCQGPTTLVAYGNGTSNPTVCSGANVNLTKYHHEGGGCACGSWQYAWKNCTTNLWWNGASFSSATPVYNSSYISINTSITANTTFTLRMKCSACASGDYTDSNITVSLSTGSTAATSITGVFTVCPGTSTTLTVNGGSLGSGANWVWYSGSCGGTYVGVGSSISVSPGANTTYYVRAEGSCSPTACVSQLVTVLSNSITATSATAVPSTIVSGGNSNLSVVGGTLGTGAQWVWYTGSCGGTPVGTGATINTGALTATTTYYVRAVGTCNNTPCVSVTVYVPGSVSICPGNSVKLERSGGTLGSGASWKWYSGSCGGTYISTGDFITVSPATNTTYFVRAEGTCNTTGCATVQVVINTPSTAASSISGTNSTICAGGSSTLTLNGGSLGTGATWQWYSGSCGGTAVGNGTSITVSPATTTTYFVRAEGICNSTNCVQYTVTVVPDPNISITANGTTGMFSVCSGANISFVQTNSGGTGTVTNQWQYSTNGTTWTNWTTSTNPTYNNITSSLYFRCVRTATGSGCGDATSNIIQVVVEPDPYISLQPEDPGDICIGGTSHDMITLVLGGTGSIIYQWQYYNGSTWVNVSNGTPVGAIYSGSASTTFSVSGISVAGVYQYRCSITQTGLDCGSLISNTVTLEVKPAPAITAYGDITICDGGNATIFSTTTIEGAGILSYQWQSGPSGTGPWSNIGGATTQSYHTPELHSTIYYHVLLSSTGSGCGSATSNAVQITFQPDPSITDNPDNGTICPGGSHQMFADATGGVGSYHYVWQYYNGSTWIDAQDSSINHYTASPGSSTNYRVIVMSDGSGCDVATSGTATVTVVAEPIAPTATKSPNVATVCSGTTLTLTGVTDNGGGTGSCNFEYCYSTNGGSSYSAWSTSLPSFAATGTNNRIKLRKNCNGSGCDISPETTYTWAVDAASVGGTASANPSTAICAGETADLSVSGYTGSIQWQTNASGSWANIPGATSNTYTTPQLPVTTSYQAVVTNGVCSSSANSNIITVTVITPITTGLSGNDYIWTGATSQTWNGATTTNWLKFISASVFEIPAQVPDITDNVFIRSNGSCFGTIPVVTTTNVAECNNLTIDPGCGLNISATGNLKIYGNLTNNGTLSVFSTAPIEIKGNWNNSGDFNAGSGNVLFSGSNIQSIKSNNDSFYGIEFNNSHAGNYDLTLTDNLTVTYNAKFVNGIVNTGSNKFIFTAPATTTVGTTTSFVDGLVEKLGCVKFTFPTGNVNPARDISAGPQYYRIWAPLTATVFSPPATVNVKYLFTNENLNPWWYHVWTHEAPLTHTSDREYWLVNSPSNLEVELFWNNNNPCSIHDFCAPGPTDFLQDELTVAYWNGIWKDAGGSPTGTYNTGDITSTIYIPFGAKGERQITFGAKDTELPLPVDLIKFYAECDNNSAIISWETASETNNDYFILEKSNDMISFFELARIEGAGNSNTLLSYSNVDNELFSGNNYYRLKQVDYDGRTRTYNTISINCDKSSSELPSLIAYPNPFTNELNVVIDNIQESDFVLELYDNIGKLIFSQEYTTEETSFHTVLDLTNLLPAVYNLRSRSEGCVMNVKVVKK